MPEGILKQRIRRIYDWAIAHNTLSEGSSKNFSLGVRTLDESYGFFWVSQDGSGYIGLGRNRFKGNEEIGRGLLASLSAIGLLHSDKSYEEIRDGRNFAIRLDKLDESDFETLIDVLGKYTS